MTGKLGSLLGLILLAGPVHAVNPGGRPVALSDEQQANIFADQLLNLTQLIADQYVREVSQPELLMAALTGLYETARQPLPAGTAWELKQAKTERERLALLINARRRLGDEPSIAGERAVFASVRALSSVLDPHCVLVPASDFQRGTTTIANFGFDFDYERGFPNALLMPNDLDINGPANLVPSIPFRVSKVQPGGPAQRAGLRPKDVLTNLDGQAITSDTSVAIYSGLLFERLDPGSPRKHRFAILREGRSEPIVLEFSQEIFDSESVFGVHRSEGNDWNYWLDKQAGIAYIRIGAIDLRTPGQLAEAISSLRDMRGLILDLRWCPGGFLTPAAEIAALFLDKGSIASVKYRNVNRQGPGELRADGVGMQRAKFTDVPLLVLVNGDTSGGGELIAAALQDNERAKVAGQRTLGKASVQTPLYLNGIPDYAFKLTAGAFVRPNGKNLQRFSESKPEDDWGVRPDKNFQIPVTPGLGSRLKDWHSIYILRPPTSRDTLPLDDPEADPQRMRAMRLLKEMIAAK